MTFEVIQPDGSTELISGRDFACAKIWSNFNSDLKWLVESMNNLRRGESFEHGGKVWKRVT